MNATDVVTKVRDAMTVRTAIGEPVVQDTGGGFGMTSTPIGAFVIKDGDVSWRPAIDINKIVLGSQIVAVVALLTLRAILKSRRS